ncbi:MAG TPA: penicillin-binding protein 2 [Candidatus Paceibacterota bacterium]|nr:penicillin-binding protein 2 [Candidatus Paceibacterota bacterium]
MRAQFRFRIRLIFLGIIAIALLIVVRLYFVQIVHGDDYALKADRQFTSSAGGLFDRGSIYFTRKDGTLISAATLETGFLVALNPQTLTNADTAYAAIQKVASTSVDRETFFAASRKTNQVYIEVAHHLSDAAGHALATQKIPGIQVLRERWRSYPGDTLASQAVGIVSFGSTDTLSGRTGLEAYYEATLSRTGDAAYKNFFATLFSNAGDFLVDAKNAREGNVVTTIEPAVETRLASDLAAVQAKYHSKETGGIIMDPATGAIIALGSVPTYDSNDLSSVRPSVLGNPLVEHVYEFGSIMKPLTMASGLDAGAITTNSTYKDTGCITVDTYTICNFDLKARGTATMQQILSQSLNLGVAWIATQLGQEKFRTYFTSLFGQKTGIDLPSETGGLLGNLSKPQQIGYDTAAFGQGIAITPVQMVRALSALANGGAMTNPHLVSAIKLDSGVTRAIEAKDSVPVFSSRATEEVSTMLTYVVDHDLAHGKDTIPSMSVAAKTGTAQLTKPGGGYYKDRYFHSFFGYFPSYAPRFIILLYTNDPQGVQYASETLTSTFMDLTQFLIEYYHVPPDRAVTSTNP